MYRVHVLPESMHSLVWDFGRLQPDVEEKYICQIVKRYVNTRVGIQLGYIMCYLSTYCLMEPAGCYVIS